LNNIFGMTDSDSGSFIVGETLRKTAVVPIAAVFKEWKSSKVPGQIVASSRSNSNAAGDEGSRTRA
jgi:hypothetical protein